MLKNVFALLLIAASVLPAQSPGQPKVTHVLAILSLTPGTTRQQINPVMQEEVQDIVRLYLAGKIEQWYARGDGKGVVFLMNCASVDEAKALLDALPLAKHNFASFDYMPLGPLSPLRLLINDAAH
jgi:hypothetical protein